MARIRCIALLVCVSIVVIPVAAEEVFISEYAEGSDVKGRAAGDRAVEIFNPTLALVDLSQEGYVILIYQGGEIMPTYTVYLFGQIAPGGTYVVISTSTADPTLIAAADQMDTDLIFDGDDAVVLARGIPGRQVPEYLDAIGQVGVQPPGGCWCYTLTPPCTCTEELRTVNVSLRRSPSYPGGIVIPTDPFSFDPTMWQGYPPNDFDGFGHPGYDVPVELISLIVE